MKIVEFTIPVAKENSLIVKDEILPHFYTHLHRHAETQITWIIKGEGTIIAGNYMQPFKAGDIYILGANQPHILKSDSAYFDKQKKLKVHSLTFFFNTNGLFQSVFNIPEIKVINKFIETSIYGLQMPMANKKQVVKEMLLVKNSKQGFRIAAFIRLLQILAEIKDWKVLSSISPENSFSDVEGLRMNEIYQYTMSHYSEHIKLEQVAKVAFLSPQAFCRYFKKHTRKTYVTFLSEIRINEACKKIIASDFDSISSIAYDVGFNSAASFNRVFKKIIGKSPKQYHSGYKEKTD